MPVRLSHELPEKRAYQTGAIYELGLIRLVHRFRLIHETRIHDIDICSFATWDNISVWCLEQAKSQFDVGEAVSEVRSKRECNCIHT